MVNSQFPFFPSFQPPALLSFQWAFARRHLWHSAGRCLLHGEAGYTCAWSYSGRLMEGYTLGLMAYKSSFKVYTLLMVPSFPSFLLLSSVNCAAFGVGDSWSCFRTLALLHGLLFVRSIVLSLSVWCVPFLFQGFPTTFAITELCVCYFFILASSCREQG
jgi:hypothetical protein